MKDVTEVLASDRLGPAPKTGRKAGPFRRMYQWTIHWAQTPYALWALLIVAFVEASFFPIPPDVLLIAMALARPRRSLWYAGLCTFGSVMGALLGYAIGMFLFEAVGRPLIQFYGAWNTYLRLSEGFRQNGFLWVFAAALTPIPYKVFTIASGACSLSLTVMIVASVIGRGLRFFGVGALFMLFGPPIKRFVERYFNVLTVAFLVLLVLGFLLVKVLWRGKGAHPPAAEPAPVEMPVHGGSSAQVEPAP